MTPNQIKQNSRVWDDVAAEILSTIAPYGLAILSVVMIGASASEDYKILTHWHPIALAIAAFFMVISGLAIYSTAFDVIFNEKTGVVVKVIAGACAVVYTVTFAVMVLVLKLQLTDVPQWVVQLQSMLPFAAMVLLDAASITNLTIRRKTYKITITPKTPAKGANGGTRKRPGEQSNEERMSNLDEANKTRTPTNEEYIRVALMRREGYTRPEVSESIGRGVSTVDRWANKGEELLKSQNGVGPNV